MCVETLCTTSLPTDLSPLKQGLRTDVVHNVSTTDHLPLKQGLRLVRFLNSLMKFLADHLPLNKD